MKDIFWKASSVMMVFALALALSGCSDSFAGPGPIPQPQPGLFTVTFNGNGGTPASTTATVNPGAMAAEPADPTFSGWVFVGWFSHQTTGVSPFNFYTPIWQDTTLWARWSLNPHRVTFNLQGGSWHRENHVYVDAGNEVPRLSNPTIEGNFVFGGWFTHPTDKDTQWEFSTPVTAPVTLFAHWEPYVRVTFQMHLESDYVYIPPRTTVSRPENVPARQPYIFTGWFTAPTGGVQWNFADPVTQDTTIYAQWRDFFIVTFGEAGGVTPAAQNVPMGQTAAAPTGNFTSGLNAPIGGLFRAPANNWTDWTLYWYLGEAEWDFADPVARDMHLTARWKTPYGPINLAGQWGNNIVSRGFDYVYENPGNYYLFLGYSLTLPPGWPGPGIAHTGIGGRLRNNSRITLIGLGEERVIRRPGSAVLGSPNAYFGSLFAVDDGAELILGNNITLGTVNNTLGMNPLVLVGPGGTVTMREASRITGHRLTHTVGQQWLGIGTAAVLVFEDGTFTMTGGEISGNSSVANFAGEASGLHALPGSTINLQGGRIVSNRGPAGTNGINSVILGVSVEDDAPINFTISGNAEVEDLVIVRFGNVATRHTITVAQNWTGSINRLNLLSQHIANVDAGIDLWEDTNVFVPVSGQSLPAGLPGRITTNSFFIIVGSAVTTRAISSTHEIENDGRLAAGSGGGRSLLPTAIRNALFGGFTANVDMFIPGVSAPVFPACGGRIVQ